MDEKPTYEELERRVQQFQKSESELKMTEKNLREREERYRSLIDSSPLPFLITQEEKIVFVNPAVLGLFGVKNENEIIGTSPKAWTHPNIMEWAFQRRCQALEKNEALELVELTLVRKDGHEIAVLANTVCIRHNGMSAILSMFQDITERKRADENLKKSEARHGKMLANIGDVIVIIDQDGINRYKSPNIEKLFGWKPEEVVGASTWDNVHPDDIEFTQQFFEKIMHTPDAVGTIECRYRCKDGSYKWIEFSGSNLFHDPDIQGLLGNYQDITERKKAEKALAQKSKLLEEAQVLANLGSWEWDIVHDTWYFSEQWKKINGVSDNDLDSSKLIENAHPEDAPYIEKAFTDAKEQGKIYNIEHRIIRADNKEIRYIKAFGEVEFDQDTGRPVRMVGAIQDITESLRMEQALRDSEQMYRTTFDAIPDSITVTRLKDGRYKYVNDGFCNITGYSRVEVIGKTPIEINLYVNHSDRERMTQILRQNRELLNFEIPFRRKNGTIFDSFFSARPIIIDGEDCLIALAKDVTEFKRAEEEKAKLERQLQQIQKMESIGSLAGGIAHDFNNLLFPIVGLSEMMLNDFPTDSLEHQNIREIFTAGTRGRELVQQILSFSRQSEHQPIPVHIQKILKEVLKLCRATIPADITITRDIQIDCGSVMADPTQIHQIAMNLITNAYHAVESIGGTITVQLKETDFIHEDAPDVHMASGRYVVLSISDTGTGIDPAVMKKIFEPYFTTKEKGRGTGLGLATVYGIVKAHGGGIKAHSEVGKGSSFHVYLPLLEKSADVAPDKRHQPLPTGTEHILLVDDELPITKLEKQLLERLGYKIDTHTSSPDALDAFRKSPYKYDLIISDMSMPQMTGKDLAEELMKIRPDIPIIICTGFSERFSENDAKAMDIKGFLMKPVVIADMAKEVRRVLDMASDKS